MAEALAVIGLVSAIVQFVEFSSKIIERLNEFQSSIDKVPQTFRDLKIQLPLLRETLKKTKTHAEAGFIDTDIQTAILNVVKGCQEQVELLDNILAKTLPVTGDSRIRRGVKAFSSVGQEKDVDSLESASTTDVSIWRPGTIQYFLSRRPFSSREGTNPF